MTGAQLKAKREQIGLTQSQLAKALGVNVGTISRWERDAREIPPYLELALQALKRPRKR